MKSGKIVSNGGLQLKTCDADAKEDLSDRNKVENCSSLQACMDVYTKMTSNKMCELENESCGHWY